MEFGDKHTEGNVKMEAKTGVMCPRNAKDCQQSPGARRHGMESPSELTEEINCDDNSFWTPGLSNCQKIHFCHFKPPRLW